MFIGDPLVGESFRSVGEVDDPAVGESGLLDDVAHYAVVPVGVDADVGGMRGGIFNDLPEHAVAARGAGDAVDHEVGGGGVEPFAVD